MIKYHIDILKYYKMENGNNNTTLSKLIELQKLVKKESSLNELCKVKNYNIIKYNFLIIQLFKQEMK